jgi:hypothetical protein
VAVVSAMVKLLAGFSEPKSGVRASIINRYPSLDLIATHLQLHLAITKMISHHLCKAPMKCFMLSA